MRISDWSSDVCSSDLWAEIAELRVLADHDSLTGLANRRRMLAELEDVVEDCRRHGGAASLVFMDLNRLKMLNDSHGHQAGDAAIVQVARIIREPLPGGFAARKIGSLHVCPPVHNGHPVSRL